jgi:hypothetical protein
MLVDQLDPAVLHQIAEGADHLELLTALRIGSAMVCRWPAGPGSLAPSPSAATSQAAEGVEHGHGG